MEHKNKVKNPLTKGIIINSGVKPVIYLTFTNMKMSGGRLWYRLYR
jgi:hypothetical protein